MRLWSLHPSLLDSKGLVACWREALLAKKVLSNQTKGYKNHPQLKRFLSISDPVKYINAYLEEIYNESLHRGMKFDKDKFTPSNDELNVLTINSEQIKYEWEHLLKKIAKRDIKWYNKIKDNAFLMCHPMFTIIDGPVELWEKMK